MDSSDPVRSTRYKALNGFFQGFPTVMHSLRCDRRKLGESSTSLGWQAILLEALPDPVTTLFRMAYFFITGIMIRSCSEANTRQPDDRSV